MITAKIKNKQQLIALVGLIGAGKDTAADYLVNLHEFRRESFAATLKDAVAAVFGWDRIMLEGRTKQAREWREQPDVWWSQRLGMPDLTPRWVLQHWGTEVCRRAFHDDVWIASLENRLRQSRDNIVISDCRFPNEIGAIKRAGGRVVRIVRGAEPEWYALAQAANAGPSHIDWCRSRDRLMQYGIHASETAWVGTDFDAVLDNNGTLDQLYQQVQNLISA